MFISIGWENDHNPIFFWRVGDCHGGYLPLPCMPLTQLLIPQFGWQVSFTNMVLQGFGTPFSPHGVPLALLFLPEYSGDLSLTVRLSGKVSDLVALALSYYADGLPDGRCL